MQTFLPYADLGSVNLLDYRRLGKQRVEAWQVFQTLTGSSKGWANHPAVRMWIGHEGLLARYGIACCEAWIDRGYNDTMLDRFRHAAARWTYSEPLWWDNEAFHSSHRSNLLRKDPDFYGRYGWDDDPAAPYIWPKPDHEVIDHE